MILEDFEEQNSELSEEEQKRKVAFEERTAKQMKATKRILTYVFSIIGVVFLVIGLIALFIGGAYDYDVRIMGIVFSCLGGFYVLLGLILNKVLPEKLSYEKYAKNAKRYGTGIDSYSQYAELELQKDRIDSLEKEVAELKKEVAELKEYRGRYGV